MTTRESQYWPTLDGIRAAAIGAVVAYHLGDLGGGGLGVGNFFVLSGYLITTLLLREHRSSGRVRLQAFWARRAKRLLPAVLLLLVVVAVAARAGRAGLSAPQLRGPAMATLLYVANWQQMISGHGYFAQFAAPNPLLHTWSLAVEEQYYLFWPLLLLIILRVARGSRRRLAAGVGAIVVASAVWMGVAAHVLGVNRAYLGTDTRAWELLLGALAAVVFPPTPAGAGGAVRSRAWSVVTVVGVIGVAIGVAFASGPPAWMWDGGAVAICVCVVAVIVGSVRAPAGVVGLVLALPPVRWVGRISYSLYLWHWPAIILVTGQAGAWLTVRRLAAMTGAACVSYYVVECPLRFASWRAWSRRALMPVAFAGVAAVVLAATVTPVQAGTGPIGGGSVVRGAVVGDPVVGGPVVGGPVVGGSVVGGSVGGGSAEGGSAEGGSVGGGSAAGGSLASGSVEGGSAAGGSLASGSVEGGSVLGGAEPVRVPSVAPVAPVALPLRVWMLGDSVMFDAAIGLRAALEATGQATVVASTPFGGWGLTTDHAWPTDAAQIIAQSHPNVVIGTWSWDDPAAAADPAGYTARLRAALGNLFADGVRLVVLLQFPQTGPSTRISDPVQRAAAFEKQTGQQDTWDRAAAAAVQAFPGRALYLSTDALFAPGGRYMTWLPAGGAWVRARKIDNTHLCPYGAFLLGELVIGDLGSAVGLGPPQPGWQAGPWSHDRDYNDPPGACPADQPPKGYAGVKV